MMRSMLTSLSLVMTMAACNIEIGYPAGEKNFIAFNRLDMDDSVATEAQEEQRMLPPIGAVHTKQFNYPFARLAGRAEAGDVLKNPLPMTPENLAVGQTKYNQYCALCHGMDGLGPMSKSRSSATERGMIPGNNLTDERVYKLSRERPGEIFHVITAGAAIMGSYAGQLEPLERWAVVHYIHTLGMVQNPPSVAE